MMLFAGTQKCEIDEVKLPTAEQMCMMGTCPVKDISRDDKAAFLWYVYDFIPAICPAWYEHLKNNGDKMRFLDLVNVQDECFGCYYYKMYITKWKSLFLTGFVQQNPSLFGKRHNWRCNLLAENEQVMDNDDDDDNDNQTNGKRNVTMREENWEVVQMIDGMCKDRRNRHKRYYEEWLHFAKNREYPMRSFTDKQVANWYMATKEELRNKMESQHL